MNLFHNISRILWLRKKKGMLKRMHWIASKIDNEWLQELHSFQFYNKYIHKFIIIIIRLIMVQSIQYKDFPFSRVRYNLAIESFRRLPVVMRDHLIDCWVRCRMKEHCGKWIETQASQSRHFLKLYFSECVQVHENRSNVHSSILELHYILIQLSVCATVNTSCGHVSFHLHEMELKSSVNIRTAWLREDPIRAPSAILHYSVNLELASSSFSTPWLDRQTRCTMAESHTAHPRSCLIAPLGAKTPSEIPICTE